jgi:AraC family transcriptional regulator
VVERCRQLQPKSHPATLRSGAVAIYTLCKPRETAAMRNTRYGTLLSKRFGILNPPTFVTSVSRGAPLTFTRLRLDSASPTCDGIIPAEEAYSFHVNFLKQESFSISRKTRAAERYFLGEGDSTMLDYSEISTMTLHSPLDTVRLYVPRSALQDFVREEYGSSEVHLKTPQQVIRDPILYHLGAGLSALFEHSEENNSLLVDQIALSLQNHLYQTYSATPGWNRQARGGLAPWQESRAKEVIDANLDKEINIARLACECGLSASQFARAFRQSTGCPPHRWLLQRRIKRARDLLLNSDKTLVEIAKACGFSDQSHLTRAFGQMVGTSPGLWRRAKRA